MWEYNEKVSELFPKRYKEDIRMAQVNKSTMIGELLQIDQNIAPILLNIGMHCLGCPSSQMETIEQAAMVHGIDPDALVKEINDFLAKDLA
jgi:hybrid cluster-associated redox disulfide protein